MKEYFLKNINTFLLLIIGGLLVLNMLKTKEVKTDVKGYQEKINTLQTHIDSAQIANKVIESKIEKVDEKIVNTTKEINHINKNIEIIKTDINEKINDVDNFGVNELELFFTNRYK